MQREVILSCCCFFFFLSLFANIYDIRPDYLCIGDILFESETIPLRVHKRNTFPELLKSRKTTQGIESNLE